MKRRNDVRNAAIAGGLLLAVFTAQAQQFSLFNVDFEELADLTGWSGASGQAGPGAFPALDLDPYPLPNVNSTYIANAGGRLVWGADEEAKIGNHPGSGDAVAFDIDPPGGSVSPQEFVAGWRLSFDVVKNFIPTSLTYDSRVVTTGNAATFTVAWRASVTRGIETFEGDWDTYTTSSQGGWIEGIELLLPGANVLLAGDNVVLRTVILVPGGETGERTVMFDNIGVNGVVPEPSTYAMFFGLGLAGFAAYRRMRQA